MTMQRRDFMLAGGAMALGAAVPAASAPGAPASGAMPAGDGYFLSPRNPVANRDQRELEAIAVALLARPDIQAAKARTSAAFARVTDHTVSAEAWSMFPAYVDSYCFRSIQLAVNSDANFPRVLRVYSPAAKWLGNDVPASRWGAENPDNCYRIIPVAFGGRYVVRGQRQANPASHVSYVLVADTNTSVTVGMLEQQAMDIAPDGSFAITLDETPANGRPNHIQLTPEAMYLFVRDSMGDWRQTPDALRVERLNPPARGPMSVDEIAARAARVMQLGVAPAYYWQRLVLNIPAATMHPPELTGASGGLLTQMSTAGWFRLAPDEAVIITTDPVDAAYHSMVLYDVWGRTLEYRDHQTSLNDAQMAPDGSGRFTHVVSPRDPGVHNWLDTMGISEITASFRWQGIRASARKTPQIETRVVKQADLAAALPAGARLASPQQRARQMEARRQTYDRRFIEA